MSKTSWRGKNDPMTTTTPQTATPRAVGNRAGARAALDILLSDAVDGGAI